MTTTEFSNEFDILYNNLRNNSAPGIDMYEKSVLLTKAQEQLVLNYYRKDGNKYFEGFENSEKRKKDLEKLIVNYKISASFTETPDFSISKLKSYVVPIPSNVMFIIQEQVKVGSEFFNVVPVSHDEIMLQKSNPFRQPSTTISNKAWRLDNTLGSGENSIEVIMPQSSVITEYQMRYLKKPNPIILTNLDEGEFTGMNLSIDGETEEATSELNPTIHRQIVDRAVELALEAYEKGRIQSFPMIASRNE